MNITNKDVIQSYIVTTARYDFNVYEKRIVYRIVEIQQELLEGKKLHGKYSIDKQIFDLYDVTMPISALLNGEDDTNYKRTKDALVSLSKKQFIYEDDKIWKAIPLILLPKIHKYGSTVSFRLHEDVYDALMNFSKGYRKYELKTAFEFESAFSMRFYELFSEQKNAITYSIETLKVMFGVEGKYKQTGDFIRWVVIPAQKELNEKSPYSFEYDTLTTGKRITAIKFYPVVINVNRDNDLERKRLQKQVNVSWDIERATVQYLKEHFMFSEVELRNNIDVLKAGQKKIPDFILWISKVKARANRAGNPKGYLINAIKKELNTKPKRDFRSQSAKTNDFKI